MSTKNIMYVLGIVLIIVGLLGFFNDPVLGIFETDMLHNLVHLGSGILALIFAGRGASGARSGALILGIVYALVTVLGFLSGEGKLLGLIEINSADNFLHLLLAVIFLIFGLKKAGDSAPSAM